MNFQNLLKIEPPDFYLDMAFKSASEKAKYMKENKRFKDKDLVELKRAINKLKKTCEAIEGDIAGFGDDYIVVTPSFAEIYRTKETEKLE